MFLFILVKPAKFGGHGGIRRIPEKNDYLRQQKMSQIKPQTPKETTTNNYNNHKLNDKLKQLPTNDDSLEDINLDSSMSKSIEEALFYQPFAATGQQQQKQSAAEKRLQGHPDQPRTTNAMDTQTSNEDSSILKLSSEMDSQISSTTCTDSLNDSSILPSNPAAVVPSAFTPPSSLNVQSPFKGISLKDFESHRKMIEEQNRQKKEMLHKAIEQQ